GRIGAAAAGGGAGLRRGGGGGGRRARRRRRAGRGRGTRRRCRRRGRLGLRVGQQRVRVVLVREQRNAVGGHVLPACEPIVAVHVQVGVVVHDVVDGLVVDQVLHLGQRGVALVAGLLQVLVVQRVVVLVAVLAVRQVADLVAAEHDG